jgi:hypothetical protein
MRKLTPLRSNSTQQAALDSSSSPFFTCRQQPTTFTFKPCAFGMASTNGNLSFYLPVAPSPVIVTATAAIPAIEGQPSYFVIVPPPTTPPLPNEMNLNTT